MQPMPDANSLAHCNRRDIRCRPARNLALIAVVMFLIGCSRESPKPESATTPPPQVAAPTKTVEKSAVATKSGTAETSESQTGEAIAGLEKPVSVHTDAKGRKWLGDVPYDVFFDHPLAVAAEGGSPASGDNKMLAANSNSQSSPPSEVGAAKNPAPAEKSAGGAENAWGRLVDADVLDAEVKRIRNDLAAQLQSVSKYNSHYQEIAIAGTTLAMIGEIMAEHSGSTSWKANAPLVRDLGAKIHDAAKAPGASALHTTKTSYEQLVDVLDGNVPAGVEAAQPRRDFSEIAKRDVVMKRMDHSFQWLKKTGPAQQILKKQSATALQEASLLAALGRVITVGHYDSADDPKYKGHADDLSKSAAAIAAAVKADDATAFTDAVSRVQKRCDACHADYRFQ
jgi:hypothetical protein